jgi:serine/threonine-protein kinase RsbW
MPKAMITMSKTDLPDTAFEPNKIELRFPANPAYASVARMTTAAVANRIGFNIDEIEDVKAAVSEACVLIISKSGAEAVLKICFAVFDGSIEVTVSARADAVDLNSDDEVYRGGIAMIKALMDKIDVSASPGEGLRLVMFKTHCKA